MGLFSTCFCLVYTVAGLIAFVDFLILRFYAAAVFGFSTAVVSGVTTHINWLHSKRRLNLWYEHRELDQFFWIGFWTLALGSSGFIYHLAALIVVKKFEMVLVVATIWGCIVMKSGVVLMYYAHKYCKESSRPMLIPTNET